MVLDRGGSESWCSDLAVGVDGCWWKPMRKGRCEGQRSRLQASRRYRFRAPRPGLGSILFKVIEGQNKALNQMVASLPLVSASVRWALRARTITIPATEIAFSIAGPAS